MENKKILKGLIKFTTANKDTWLSENPLIPKSIGILDIDNNIFKIGDGLKKYNDLKPVNSEYYEELIKKLDDDKVDKVDGKGLSTNDYDNVSKDKVDNIDVNLSNLMPISDGVLENYTEKLTTLASGAIDLNTGNVFTHTLSGDTTYSISNAVSGVAHSFTLIITQTSTVRTLTFPSSVKWQGGVIPDLSTASKTYILTFASINGGTTWYGMFGGEF